MKLKKQFLIFIILMTTIPITTIILSSYYFKSEFYIKKEKTLLNNEVTNVKVNILDSISNTENLLRFISKELIRDDSTPLETMSNLIHEKKEYLMIYFEYENQDRSLLVSNSFSVDTKFQDFPFEVPENFQPRTRPWYVGAKNSGKFHFSEIYTDLNTKKSVATFSLPVYKDNKLLGILGIDIDLIQFSKALNFEIVSKNSIFNIIDKNGNIILSSSTTDLGKTSKYFPLFKKHKSEGELKNENSIYLYEYLSFLDFYIFAKINKDEILKEFEPFQRFVFFIGVISLLISIFFILVFFELLENFIKKLSNSIYSIAQGNYKNRFKEFEDLIGNTQEFFDMKNALERMQENITLREKTLEDLANLDTLTMIFNRRYLFKAMDSEFEKAETLDIGFSIAILDLDNFKLINDTFGHQKGDEVLKYTVVEMKKFLRNKDILGRYGGEEFLIIFPNTEIHEAKLLCDEIRMGIENIRWNPDSLKTTISIGISYYKNQSLEKIIQEADYFLYEAKHKGKNRVEYAKEIEKNSI